MPDGRIFVFGTSLEVLDVLKQLETSPTDGLDRRLQRARRLNVPPTDRPKQEPAS